MTETKTGLAAATQRAAGKPKQAKTAPSRRGQRAWVVYLDPDTAKRIKMLAVEHDTTMQALGLEAAELLFNYYER